MIFSGILAHQLHIDNGRTGKATDSSASSDKQETWWKTLGENKEAKWAVCDLTCKMRSDDLCSCHWPIPPILCIDKHVKQCFWQIFTLLVIRLRPLMVLARVYPLCWINLKPLFFISHVEECVLTVVWQNCMIEISFNHTCSFIDYFKSFIVMRRISPFPLAQYGQ